MEYILEQSGQPISTAPDGVLSLMAEHNVKSDGTWDKDFTIPTSKDDRTYLMDWHAAMALDMPSGYHLPSQEELQSVFPWGGSCVRFDKSGETKPATITDRSATVSEGDKAKVGDEASAEVKSQFAYEPGVTYALRFIGTKHESAWKYEYVKEGGKQMLRITSVGLKDFNGTVLDVKARAKTLFASSDATVRLLPAAGYSGGYQGSSGYFWSSTEYGSGSNVYDVYFDRKQTGTSYHDKSSYAFSVRPFVGEPKVRFKTQKDGVLSQMAEYNVKSDGTWDKDHTIPTSKDDRTYLMDWGKAMMLDMPTGYHLPSREELQSIFPNEHSCVCFDKKTGETNPASITDRSATVSEGEKAKVGDETVTEVKSQFAYEPNVTYALRYIGTKHESAWKYEYVKVGGKQMLRITSIGLKDFNGTVLDVRARSKTLFASSDATVRLLPAAGDSDGKQGSVGSFYASTEQGGGVFHAAIYGSHATMGYGFKVVARSVRPFVGAQKVSFETQKDRVLSRMAEQNLCYTSMDDLGFSRDYSIPKIDDVWQVAANFMTYDQLMLPDFPTLPSGYHLPSRKEMQSIIPSGATYVLFNGKADVTYPSNITGPGDGVLEVLEPDDEAQVYGYDGGLWVKSQFAYETGVTYALRYVGTPLESAWRYQILEDNGVPMLAISSVCLKNFHGTVLDVKKNADRLFIDEMRVVRWLPLAGYSRGEQRTHGYFWTATGVLNNPEEAYCFYVNRGTYSAVQSEKKVTAFSVRLFADTPLGE